MDQSIREAKIDDLILWPDGVWCFRGNLHEYTHKSDDYRVIPVDTDEWDTFLRTEE